MISIIRRDQGIETTSAGRGGWHIKEVSKGDLYKDEGVALPQLLSYELDRN